jgi:crotonobetainyl-CoA:carnitine CoA-transferase CaiB-like acyl-CoA transferase
VIVPFVMAAGVSAALQHRRETGRGCHIDASMYEICVQQMRDTLAGESRRTPAAMRQCGSGRAVSGCVPRGGF